MSIELKQAVILCGGMGTRLGSVAKGLPKPMVPVCGIPLLQRIIDEVVNVGISRIILAAGYRSDYIEQYFKERPIEGVVITVCTEDVPLGTAGCVRSIEHLLDDNFLLLYGDIYIDFPISDLITSYYETASSACLTVRHSDHPWDSHLVDVDDSGVVREFITERIENRAYKNVANAAIYVLSKAILKWIPEGRKSDFGEDVFPRALKEGVKITTYFLSGDSFVKDMGTPDRLRDVESYVQWKLKVDAARCSVGKDVKIAFLDRDGTINKHVGHVTSCEQIELLPGVSEGIALLNLHGIRCVITTNQPVIARGLCSLEKVDEINNHLLALLGDKGARIDDIYLSPFHPETHHGEGIPELRRASFCRKPAPGMIKQAVDDLGLDLAECVMVGDSEVDIAAAKAAGIRSILVGGTNGCRYGASCSVHGLLEAAEIMVSGMGGDSRFSSLLK